MKKDYKKKFWIGVGVGAGVSVVALGAFVFVFFVYMLLGETHTTTDIAQFEGITEQHSDIESALIVFPEKIPENVKETDFYYSYTVTLFDTVFEIYLQCEYTQEDYEKEIERLENTRKRYGSQVNRLLKDNGKKFQFPAYIAQENDYMAYEYALLTGEREITYIFSSHFSYDSTIFEEQYLPIYTKGISDKRPDSPGYSIYDFRNIEDDYTRNELAQIEIHHGEDIGYNRFYVSVLSDERGKEMIKGCSYVYYKSRTHFIYGFAEVIDYTELAGYEFVSLELNQEKTKAYVTYLDEGVEKVREYEME